MNARRPSRRPGSSRPGRDRRAASDGRGAGGHARQAGRAADRPAADADGPTKRPTAADRLARGGGDSARSGVKRRGAQREGPRRGETRRPRTGRRRFATRRSVVVDAASGPKHISLRLVSIALFAIIAVIVVTPTLSNYLDRQRELRDLKARLSSVQQHNKDLERELALWRDDDYVRSQARERLGYVMPGQTLHVVTDSSKGSAQEQLEKRVASVNRDRRAATPWYSTMWDSVKVAGQSGTTDNPDNTPIIEETTNGQ